MRNKFLVFLLLALIFLLASASFAQEKNNSVCELKHRYRYPIMQPDEKTLKEWIAAYKRAPKAWLDPAKMALAKKRGSLSLLSHVSYVPGERSQGDCGNCWAWAGTGCLEVALDVLEGTKDRLSVQYINSCETQEIGKERCTGGWLADFASFYSDTKKAVPWSNTNASWQDGDLSYEISCAMVATTPNYPINSISEESITTQEAAQATAITNIKNILLQNKGVWFGFYLPNQTAWDNFQDFWDHQSESTVYNIDQYAGIPYDNNTGGGHAVLCVGYNDDDPNNSYWILLNSWGNASGGRPNGLFRINMNMDYGTVNTYYSFYWQNLAVQFNVGELALNSFSMTDQVSGSGDYTKSTEVNVQVSASGSPDQIGFSNNADFSGATWQTYATSTTYTLPTGDGQKTIYCRVKKSGTESNILSDTIYLDTLAPAVNFTLNNHLLKSGDYITTQPALKAVITESVGVDTSSLKFTRDGSDVSDGTSGGGHYDNYDAATKTATYAFKSALADGAHSIGFEVKDLAGNTTTLNFTGLNVSSSLALGNVMNYPNPFNNTTNFSYQLSKAADVVIKIYTVRGELVKTLTASAGSSAGQLGFNKISWDGKDEAGSDLPNGMYLYTVTATDSQGGKVTKRSKVGITK